MKKVLKTENIPPILDTYTQSNPDDSWGSFKGNCDDGFKEIKRKLYDDQRGLCAYCEIDMKQGAGIGLDDFRVEHFHPKSPHKPPPNHGLDWNNMLGVCTGGNTKGVTSSSSRFTSPDHSCDVPKHHQNLDGIILNPLNDIDPFEQIFEYNEYTGEIKVAPSCPGTLKTKADNTIKKLRLDADRLNKFRLAIINDLREKISESILAGSDETAASIELAEGLFLSSPNPWPPFFTCIRWYLGPAAEDRLHQVNYSG